MGASRQSMYVLLTEKGTCRYAAFKQSYVHGWGSEKSAAGGGGLLVSGMNVKAGAFKDTLPTGLAAFHHK